MLVLVDALAMASASTAPVVAAVDGPGPTATIVNAPTTVPCMAFATMARACAQRVLEARTVALRCLISL